MAFRDSLKLLVASSEQCTTSHTKTIRVILFILHEVVSQIYNGSDLELLKRKEVFCYDYVDSVALLN